MLEGVSAILQSGNQPGRLELDRAERPDRRPAEPVTRLVPAPQIVWSQFAGPGDLVVRADLMLESVAVEEVLCDQCQSSDAQLVSELPGQGGIACFTEAHSPVGRNQ